MNIEDSPNEEHIFPTCSHETPSALDANSGDLPEELPEYDDTEPLQDTGSFPSDTMPQDQEEVEAEETRRGSSRAELLFAAKSIGIGLLVGIIIASFGYFRTTSAQHNFANQLAKADACGDQATIPTGFCFNSPVSVGFESSNPLNFIEGTTSNAKISAPRARIGIFGNSGVSLTLSRFSGSAVGNGAPMNQTKVGSLSGTITLAYAELTNTLRSSSSTSASIFYAGKNEIGTTNEVSYQGQNIALTVTSKVSLKNNTLYLAPLTVSALGHSAPASSVFSSTAPVPVDIPKLPKGMKYSKVETNKTNLIFDVVGSNISLNSVFHS